MSFEVKLYSEDQREIWDDFVAKSINGTFLHGRPFFDCNPQNAADDHSLMFYSSGKLISVLPATLRSHEGQRLFSSHNRSTYGGFVIHRSMGVSDAVAVVDVLVNHLRSLQVTSATIRNPFRFLYDQISDEFEYAMWFHGFEVLSRELEVFIDLTPGLDTVRARYVKATRNNNTRAHRDVMVRIDEFDHLPKFWDLLEKNLADRHSTRPVHSLDEINKLIATVGKQRFAFSAGFFDNELVAGCLMFIPRPGLLHAQYIAQDYERQALRPINAVIDEVVSWGCANHFRGFNLGTGNEGGRIINSGLFHFKEGFGGRSVLRETHHLQIRGING